MEWQPIETAPKDGTAIFTWYECHVNKNSSFFINMRLAVWVEALAEWRVEGVGGNVPPTLTHWMPLPEPPKGDNM